MLLLKHAGKGRLVTALLLWALAGAGLAAQGFVEKAGTRMPVVDSVAVLDERLDKLTIYLLPTRLSADEKRRIARGSALMVLMNKGSPDSSKWNWYPYATLELQYRGSRYESDQELYGYAVMTHAIVRQNQANTLNGHFAEEEILQGYRFDGDRIRFRFAGRSDLVETRWDLDIDAPILDTGDAGTGVNQQDR
ncbi:hypothetical protein [Thiohalophilus sp.]|uniref:hypothetical protein n=1 Tax=Thiohalophilus sp. TaxID=3028392 RepID=UPI003975445D